MQEISLKEDEKVEQISVEQKQGNISYLLNPK
jgi:hypothetical protein